jgi:uroporphyrinogen-III synthase
MQSLSLTKLFAMITRPNPAGRALCALIEAEGGEAIHFPTIAFIPADQSALQTAVAKLGEQEWLIFISPQAVYASIPAIRRTWPIFPPQVKFAAVGAGTAKALQAAGYVTTTYPDDEWNSEGLLAMPAFKDVQSKKIAIIRGEGGRELLANTLSERGADITSVVAYKRIVPPIDVSVYLELLKQYKVNVIVCGSYESVSNLKTMIGEAGWPYIKNVPLLVMSERVKSLARDLDFQTIWVAPKANNEAIVAALVEKRNEICQIQQTK